MTYVNMNTETTMNELVQIERARLVEHRDFEVLPQKGENPLGGR